MPINIRLLLTNMRMPAVLVQSQRLFELGRWDEAQTEKERLEDKQRAARRLREAGYATLAALACCCGGARR